MAEVVGIIGSAIAIANSAATLSRALYEIVETIHNARREIADIAQQLQLLSGTLHMLWDYTHSQRHLCRPGLFHNTNAILEQYLQVDKDLRELVKTPKNLARLTWYIKQTKVKSLLKKVEAIKTSLSLALHVIQLAREEEVRPPTSPSMTVQTQPLPNRFRKLVESAVQANRQVVESAQRQATADSHTSSDQRRSELNLYQEGSFDTATWLYHLVFDTHMSSNPTQGATQSPRPFQASVADEATEHIVRFAHPPLEKVSEPSVLEPADVDKTMIVWGRQTEPDQVVDRLLSQWTTLSPEQIELSSTRQHDADWWESFQKVVEEAKDEAESDFEKWDMQYSSDDVDSVIEEISAPAKKVPSRSRSPSFDYGSVTSVDVSGSEQVRKEAKPKPPKQPQSYDKADPDRRKANMSRSKKHRQKPLSRPMTGQRPGESESTSETFHQWNPQPHPEPSRHSHGGPYRQASAPGYPQNPVRPGEPYFHNPVPPHWYPPPMAPFPQHSPWPFPGPTYPPAPPAPPAPGNSGDQGSGESNMQNKSTKDSKLLATMEGLLEAVQRDEKGAANEGRFEKVVHTLLAQQEQAQLNNERIRESAEVEMKQILAAREHDDAKIQRLEEQLVQQRAEQVESNARWQAERAALDHKAAEQTRQAQEVVEREIAAARFAKETELNTLKAAMAEAEKRAREAADAMAREERKKVDQENKERISKYESLIDRALDTQSQALAVKDQPLRRTCIISGNNRMEVEEYNENMRGTPNVLTTRFLEQSTLAVGANGLFHDNQPRSIQRNIDRSGTTRGPLSSSRLSDVFSNTTDLSNEDRQMILFPPHLDQKSRKINELQSSLTGIGLDVKFADLQLDDRNHWALEDQCTDVIRSSVFWEAPVLSSGSELLNTLKTCGWRPQYARSSDAGQTYFLGSQPIHSYFFRPDYRPQFSACNAPGFSESIVIDQALIQEYALLEFGFQFQVTKSGSYVLDGRLQYSDIEALVERSFAMRETYFRRAYRQLAPAPLPSIKQPRRESRPQYFEEPQSPALTSESDACETVSDSEDDNHAHLERRSSYASSSSADTCLGLESARGLSSNTSLKTTSGSRTSWSSQSNNPFRKHGSAMSRSEGGSRSSDGDAGSMISFPSDGIWDGALIDLS